MILISVNINIKSKVMCNLKFSHQYVIKSPGDVGGLSTVRMTCIWNGDLVTLSCVHSLDTGGEILKDVFEL